MNSQFDFKYLTKKELLSVVETVSNNAYMLMSYGIGSLLNNIFDTYIDEIELKYNDCKMTFEMSLNKSNEMDLVWLRKAKVFKDYDAIKLFSKSIKIKKETLDTVKQFQEI